MAFLASGFHRVPHVGGGISHFVYKTTGDTLKTVASATATGYFAYPQNSTGNINPLSTDDLLFIMASDARGWFKVSSIASSTSTPFSTAVTLEGVSPILPSEISMSTGTNLVPYGFHHSTGTTQTFTLDMPWYAGQEVTIMTTTSTSMTVLMGSTTAGSISSTGVQVLLNLAGQSVTLIGESTAKWLVKSYGQHSGTAIIGPIVT